jgi:magnesium and cobalt transporter
MPALFIPSSTKPDVLLKELQERKRHIAVIIDGKAKVLGVITLEDLLEELVGDIFDESERASKIEKINENTVEVSGATTLKKVNQVLGTKLKSEEYKTIGGYIFGKLERFAKEGEELELDGVKIQIQEASGCKILKMKIQRN